MKFLLDSNTCICFLNSRSQRLTDQLTEIDDDDICVCSIVKAEMFFGSAKSKDPKRSRAIQERFFSRYRSLAFDDKVAPIYGFIRAELERRGTPIGPNDLLIAAIAIANSLVLVTANEREFARVPGLLLENWEI